MTRDEALDLIKSATKNINLIKHMIAVEGAMRRIARELNEDEDKWGLAGLLHDLDYEETTNDFSKHGIISSERLDKMGIDKDITNAIKAHPAHIEYLPTTPIELALYSVDPLTGLIVASALMHPSKKLSSINTEFVMRRYNEKRFAAGANREQIAECSKLNIPLERFITLSLEGMCEVSDQLGL